ncbi:MAG: membrane protein insertase YidC [Elsteraceae bacterium]
MEQKNLILAIALSLAILFGFQFFYETPRLRQQQEAQQAALRAQQTEQLAQGGTAALPAAPGAPTPSLPTVPGVSAIPPAADRNAVLERAPRIKIDATRVIGSIALEGGRIDDITLRGYRETVDPNSPQIRLLNPIGVKDAYYAEFGWTGVDRTTKLPDARTRWTANRDALVTNEPLTLTWDNGEGLKFTKILTLDENFMISVTQRVENTGAAATTLHPFALVKRNGMPETQGFFILHEGLLGVFNSILREKTYSDLKDEKAKFEEKTKGGWLGITDKYWLVAVVPDPKEEVQGRFTHVGGAGEGFQVDYLGAGRALAPGQTIESNHRLFAGAKEVNLLKRYRDAQGIDSFEYAVDWGWFYFLTKPIFSLMEYIYKFVGNFGIAILLLTLIMKAIFYPLANRSYVMMSKMKKLAPAMTELKEKYGDDRARINQELMQLYKKEKVNPLSGCLPILLQIPVFFSLYKVLFVTIEMRHAPFYGWIKDLSAPDPTTIANLFGLIPWDPPGFLHLGAWPLIMGVTMWLQMKLNPQPTDPIQAKVFMIMPFMFTFMLAGFPAGLVIYWAWNNLLSMAQQWAIMRRMGVSVSN